MNIVWFRRDLRVEDNTALYHAMSSEQPVVAVYIATPLTWSEHNKAPLQADLIYRRLEVLQRELAALNIPLVFNEVESFTDSAKWLASFAQQTGAQAVHFNKEYEWNENQRDALLQEKASCIVVGHEDKCLFSPGSVKNKQGEYFKVFTPFKRAYLAKFYQHQLNIKQVEPQAVMPQSELLSEYLFSVQSTFSYLRENSEAYPVETKQVRQRLRDFCKGRVDVYKQQRDLPAIEGTSGLSAYLAIGVLSIRQCIARLQYGTGDNFGEGRETWLSELIWRDFYQHLLHFEPKLSKGLNFVPWTQNVTWFENEDWLSAWQQGQTGYPIVDAAMRQLNQTGWMHNRLRMIVASFLTKDLHLHWHHGEQYFMQRLIDGDYAANNGGWQWSASTGCDGQPYFRIFNPITQGERFDPDGEFIRAWIPELKSVPNKYIHKPWLWADVNYLSYPQPIVDHKSEREITLRLFQEAKDQI